MSTCPVRQWGYSAYSRTISYGDNSWSARTHKIPKQDGNWDFGVLLYVTHGAFGPDKDRWSEQWFYDQASLDNPAIPPRKL
jgi:hypothetical protein